MNLQRLFAFGLVFFSLKLWKDHNTTGYKGKYNPDGSYPTISPMKHDVFKVMFTELFPLLVYGIASGEQFFSYSDFLNSVLGKVSVLLLGYVIYYHIVQPYYVAKLKRF